ncbi:MAG TPA: hypothetical protein VG712_02735, partial [Gemmatimonadales bacterium]|nr:hypothetical protein [Gemmatimonadales bacterium]
MTLAFLVPFGAAAPLRLSAQVGIHAAAIPLATRAWHTPGDRTLTEIAVVQPAVMLEWESPMDMEGTRPWSFGLRATLNGEGLTIPDGELAPGDHGEGYYDRRHPHTYVHEVVASARYCGWWSGDCRLQFGVTAGKGFAAFGTDDPMSRPAVRYPVNHHLAQILERAIVIGSLRWRGLAIERSGFNGDEPTRPRDWPNWDRGLDSRAWRFSARPLPGLEAQYSVARVKSPEHRP